MGTEVKQGQEVKFRGMVVRVAELVNGGRVAIVFGPANFSGVVRVAELEPLS